MRTRLKKAFGMLLGLTMCFTMLPMTVFAEDITLNKTATELNDKNETEVTLSFPGKEDQLGTDIVFVLDKSGASDEKGVNKQALDFLADLKKQADEKNLDVKVGVVSFNYIGNVKSELRDIKSGYKDIISAMKSKTSMGTNMHAGLLAAKKLLDNDKTVKNSRKHFVLISDGATYLYSKNGDYTKAYTRSFGNPKAQTNPSTGTAYTNGADRKGGIWEYQSREYNTPNNFKKFSDGSNFIFSQASSANGTIQKLGEYLNYYKEQDLNTEKNWAQYEYKYTFASSYLGRGRKTTPIDVNAPSNIDVAWWSTDETFQEMVNSKYTPYVFYKNAADFDGSLFLKYLVRNSSNGQLTTDFASLTKAVNNLIDKGSVVEDEIGKDFDFINDSNSIFVKVGEEKLTANKLDNGTYAFGPKKGGTYRYELTYKSNANKESENLTLKINETVFPDKPIQLVYREKLVNVPKEDGNYTFNVNEKAVLTPMDSNGNTSDSIDFPVPHVTLSIKNPVVTFMNDSKEYAKVKVENSKSIDTDTLDTESMPENPTKEGYVFKEWNTQADGKGTAFTGSTTVNEDITVYAIYNKKAEVINSIPTIEIKDATITKGDNFDLKMLVVKATDKEDGDLTDKVTILDDGGFDKNKVGEYTVTFEVKDSKGATVKAKAKVTVKEKEVTPVQPETPKNPTTPANTKKPITATKTTATGTPQTGDTNNMALYGSLLGLSALSLLGFALYRRKQNKA